LAFVSPTMLFSVPVAIRIELLVGLEQADFSHAQTLRGKGVLESQQSRIGWQTRELLCEHRPVKQLMHAGGRQHLFISGPSFRAKSLLRDVTFGEVAFGLRRHFDGTCVATPISW
jgi:hypothetical protein